MSEAKPTPWSPARDLVSPAPGGHNRMLDRAAAEHLREVAPHLAPHLAPCLSCQAGLCAEHAMPATATTTGAPCEIRKAPAPPAEAKEMTPPHGIRCDRCLAGVPHERDRHCYSIAQLMEHIAALRASVARLVEAGDEAGDIFRAILNGRYTYSERSAHVEGWLAHWAAAKAGRALDAPAGSEAKR